MSAVGFFKVRPSVRTSISAGDIQRDGRVFTAGECDVSAITRTFELDGIIQVIGGINASRRITTTPTSSTRRSKKSPTPLRRAKTRCRGRLEDSHPFRISWIGVWGPPLPPDGSATWTYTGERAGPSSAYNCAGIVNHAVVEANDPFPRRSSANRYACDFTELGHPSCCRSLEDALVEYLTRLSVDYEVKYISSEALVAAGY